MEDFGKTNLEACVMKKDNGDKTRCSYIWPRQSQLFIYMLFIDNTLFRKIYAKRDGIKKETKPFSRTIILINLVRKRQVLININLQLIRRVLE